MVEFFLTFAAFTGESLHHLSRKGFRLISAENSAPLAFFKINDSEIKNNLVFILNSAKKLFIFASDKINYFIMARYISSVSVTLSSKSVQEIGPMKSFVISLDFNSGSTVFHAVNFVSKHPLIKCLLNNYHIINLTFKYSEL